MHENFFLRGFVFEKTEKFKELSSTRISRHISNIFKARFHENEALKKELFHTFCLFLRVEYILVSIMSSTKLIKFNSSILDKFSFFSTHFCRVESYLIKEQPV